MWLLPAFTFQPWHQQFRRFWAPTRILHTCYIFIVTVNYWPDVESFPTSAAAAVSTSGLLFSGENVRENKQSIVPNQKRVHTHRLHTHLPDSCLVFSLTSKSLCRQRKQSETDGGSWNLEAFWCTGDTDVGSKKFPPFQEMHRTQSCHYCQE